MRACVRASCVRACVCVCVTVADACLIGVLATAEAVRKSKLTQAACDANVERASRA